MAFILGTDALSHLEMIASSWNIFENNSLAYRSVFGFEPVRAISAFNKSVISHNLPVNTRILMVGQVKCF